MIASRIISSVTCAGIILLYFFLVTLNAVDVPHGDDLYCLLLSTQLFHDAKNWTDWFRLLFEQWIEHRIVFSRLTALASYWIHGAVNFKSVILIGNSSLIGITIIFYKLLKKASLDVSYLIPVVLTLFSPVMYEGNLWAGASTVYMPVCFMGMLSVYLLTNSSNTSFALAILTAILATSSFGNGMFTFIAGFGVLLYLMHYKLAATWILIGLLVASSYFIGFKTYSATDAFGWAIHFRHPDYLFYNLFAFIGGIFNYDENVNSPLIYQNIPAILSGILITVILAWGIIAWSMDGYQSIDDIYTVKARWIGFTIYTGITAVAIAYSRTSTQQMTAISSRYKIYSMVTFALVYLWFLIYFERKRTTRVIFIGVTTTLLIFNYYVYYEKFVNYKSHSWAGLFNYINNGKWIIYRKSSYFEIVSKSICDSIKNNADPVFHFSSVFH